MAIRSTKDDSTSFLVLGSILVVLGTVGIVVGVKKLVGAGIIGGLMVLGGLWMRRIERRDRRVLADGLRGEAKVEKTETLIVKKHGETKLRLSLAVALRGGAPYAATSIVWADLTEVSQVARGRSVPVRVDPAEPSRVLVDWSSETSVEPAS